MDNETRTKRRWMATATGALALPILFSGCSPKGENSRNGAEGDAAGVLRVGIISTTGKQPSGPEGLAYKQGTFIKDLASAGITKIEFTPFGNGPDLNEAMAAGGLDVGEYGDTPSLVGRAAGLKTRAINQGTVGMNAWLIARADGPKTVEELRGKTVATSKGSYMARYLLGLLAEKGLSKDVKFIHLLPNAAEAALQHGDIAAYAAPSGTGPLLIQHGYKAIDQANQHPGLSGSSVTVVSEKYLAAHSDFPTIWNKARANAIGYSIAHSEEYYQYQTAQSKLPVEIVKASYPITLYSKEPFTAKGLALLGGTKAFLVQQGLAKSDFDLKGWTVSSADAKQAALPK
jgi:sulfonate transport system substrate-binding protein